MDHSSGPSSEPPPPPVRPSPIDRAPLPQAPTIWVPGTDIPPSGEWARYLERLPWGIAKEGDLIKSFLLRYTLPMEKLREPVVRASMAMTSERWNEEIGGRLENVEALFIQMVGRVATERCEYCLAGRGIFPLCVVFDVPGFVKCCGCCLYRGRGATCSLLASGPGQAILVQGSGLYDVPAATRASEGSRLASRARRDHAADINSITDTFLDITLVMNQLQANMDDIVAAAGTAAEKLHAAQSRADTQLPIRRNDVVHIRNSINDMVSSANRTKSVFDRLDRSFKDAKEELSQMQEKLPPQ